MRIFRLPLYDHRLSSYAHSIFFCLEVSEKTHSQKQDVFILTPQGAMSAGSWFRLRS